MLTIHTALPNGPGGRREIILAKFCASKVCVVWPDSLATVTVVALVMQPTGRPVPDPNRIDSLVFQLMEVAILSGR